MLKALIGIKNFKNIIKMTENQFSNSFKRNLNVSSKLLNTSKIMATDLYDINCEDNLTFLDMTKHYVDQAIKIATPLLVKQSYIGQMGVCEDQKEKFVKGIFKFANYLLQINIFFIIFFL